MELLHVVCDAYFIVMGKHLICHEVDLSMTTPDKAMRLLRKYASEPTVITKSDSMFILH